MDFLVKPITVQQIEDSLELAVKLIERNLERFEFQIGRDYHYISYGEIIYFESKGRKIKIVIVGAEAEFYGVWIWKRNFPKNLFRFISHL